MDRQKGCLGRVEGFIRRLKSIVKARTIHMGFNLFGNYFFRELGDVVKVGDRAVIVKVIFG